MLNSKNDFTISSFSTGFLVSLIGYSSSALIVFEAARKLGLSSLESSGWLSVLCISMGILTIIFSLYYKKPFLFAWSTPGAALLIISLDGIKTSDAIGAFVFSALLIFLVGITGIFEKIINKLPLSLAQAMLAGVLLKFALGVFLAFSTQLILCLSMFVIFVFSKKLTPKLSILIAMIFGIILSIYLGILHLEELSPEIVIPHFIMPTINFSVLLNIGLPLFFVTMTSQNMTGIAALKSFDYDAPISKLITFSGLMNIIVAPFGGFSLNLAAITAAICMDPHTIHDKGKRYTSAVVSGVIYICIGLFSGTIGKLFFLFPKELVAVITGLALLTTITNGLRDAISNESERDSAMITFFVTASGVTLFHIGSPFWGIVLGTFSYIIFFKRPEVLK